MHIFYTPDIDRVHEMPEEESLHCAKVLRLAAGEQVRLTDGKGHSYLAQITTSHPKRCAFSILSPVKDHQIRDYGLHIAIAPTKNLDRIEWFAEKATEMGIDGLTFLKCRFSERKELKEERIHKILVSAMKQSLKSTLPLLTGMTSFADFIRLPFPGEKYIAHCYDEIPRTPLSLSYTSRQNALVLIGPEGDFSNEEVKAAIDAGFVSVSLGKSRLRTETAALVACQTIHLINEIGAAK